MPCYFHTHGIDGCRFDDMPVYCFFAHTSIEPIRTPLATRCVKIKKNPNKSYFIDLGCGNTERSYHSCCKSMRDNFEISKQVKVRRIYPWVVGGGGQVERVGGNGENGSGEKEKGYGFGRGPIPTQKEIEEKKQTEKTEMIPIIQNEQNETNTNFESSNQKRIFSYKDILLKNQ